MREFYDRFMLAREWIDEHISIERVSGNRDVRLETSIYIFSWRMHFAYIKQTLQKPPCQQGPDADLSINHGALTINNFRHYPIQQHYYEINTNH